MSEEMRSDADAAGEFVTLMVGDQLCGLDLLMVREVLTPRKLTRVPLAPPDVTGVLNLRGRIVTAIDLRRRLGLEIVDPGREGMSIVIERRGELYSLAVDAVGEY